MQIRAGQVLVNYVEHGTGRPVLVLHGAGVDHRETEACFEPVFDGVAGLRRIYLDLPGMGRTVAPETLCSADHIRIFDEETSDLPGCQTSLARTRSIIACVPRASSRVHGNSTPVRRVATRFSNSSTY